MSQRPGDQRSGSDDSEEQSFASARDAGQQRSLDSSRYNYDQSMEVTLQSDSSYGDNPESQDHVLANEGLSSHSQSNLDDPPRQQQSITTPSFFNMDQSSLSSMWSNQAPIDQGTPYSLMQPATGATNAMLSPTAPFEDYSAQAYPPPSSFETAFSTSSMTPFVAATSGAGGVHQEQNSQPASPNVTLVQLGASQNHLLNNQPAPWIRALDVDRSYRGPQTPSLSPKPVLCLYVRIPDYEPYHRALYLRERTVQEFIKCMAGKYGLNADERGRIRRVVIRTPIGTVPVDDDDINALRNETEMFLKCALIQGEVDTWQLEIS